MRCGMRTFLALVACCVAAHAQDAKKEKQIAAAASSPVFQLPKEVELTAEQQAKLEAVKKEYAPKVAELQGKLNEILSPEQRKARKEAADKAKEDKLTGKERTQAVTQALKLTPEQQDKWDKTQKELNDLTASIRGKIGDFLTEEQRMKVPGLKKKNK